MITTLRVCTQLAPTSQCVKNPRHVSHVMSAVGTTSMKRVANCSTTRLSRSVAILAQAISCSNVHGVFPFTSFSGFVLSKCLQLSFVVSHLFSWHVRAMEQMCQYLCYQPLLRISVLLMVLFLTLKGQDTAPVRWRRKSTKCSYKSQSCHHPCRVNPDSKIASRRFPRQWLHMMHKITNIEQIVSSLAARVTMLETYATSASSGSGSASSWNLLGHSNGSTATGSLGSHGPGSSDDNRNTRRRLDTFSSPENEHARSAVQLQLRCEQYHAGVSMWINSIWKYTTYLVQTHQGSLQNRWRIRQTRIRDES